MKNIKVLHSNLISQILLLVLAFVFCLVSAGKAQQELAGAQDQAVVYLDSEEATIQEMIFAVEAQTNYRFSFDQEAISTDEKFSTAVGTQTINNLLVSMARQTGLSYQILNQNIHLKNHQVQDRQAVQLDTVDGMVTDETNAPLPGVNIIVKGTTTGTSTDVNGTYGLQVESLQDTLVFSFIGYQTKEVPINGRTEINVSLTPQAIQGEEMVVVGFGRQKKANITGSVSTVSSETVESRPVRDVGQMLQGVIPGLNFQTSGLGGELNQDLSFNIRGTGTIGAGSNSAPLVLIDGTEASLNSINPKDIESITVLKDAAASAIYGSRAAFGVVLVTTKNGKNGEPIFNYSNNFRFTSPLRLPEMLDSYTFALYWNEAAANDGQGPKFSDEVIDRIIKYQNGEIDYGTVPNNNGDRWQYYTGSNANTDWFDEQYKNFAFAQDHNMSVSGGTDIVNYYASGNFLDQGGLARYAGDQLDRYTLNGKINVKISDQVSFDYSNRFIREEYSRATHQFNLFYHNIARRWPTVPVKDPNGYYSDPSEINQLREGGRVKDINDTYFIQGRLQIDPTPRWNITAEGNYRIRNRNYGSNVLPAYAHDVEGNPYPLRVGWNASEYTSVYESNRKGNYYNANVYTTYQFDLEEKHQFKVMLGGNTEVNRYRTVAASRTGLISPSVPTINTATDNSRANEGQYQHWATAGAFGRFNYNYDNRYFLEANLRYDGSSRFIKGKRWNLFPSVSGGWDLAAESFWAFSDLINQFKIRGSFGALGNQNTSNWYPFYPTMPVGVNNGNWLINGERPNTASAPALISSQLTWERVKSWNIGFDMAMFDNRLGISFDYFDRRTNDMVGPAPELPAILGTAVPRINNADMKSSGFEIETRWRDQVGDFNYSIRAVLSDDQQEILKYPNPTGNIGTWYEGRMIGEIWGYKTKGLASSQEEMDAHLQNVDQSPLGSNWKAGDIMYQDLNGDGEINGGSNVLEDTGDRTIIGNSHPRYRFSLDFTGNYKNFDFRLFLQGVGKRDWMPNGPYFWGAYGGMWQSAGFKSHMDYYRDKDSPMVKAGVAEVNKDAYYPRPYFGSWKNKQTQTRYLQDASYLRLKNLQIGYILRSNIMSAVGASNMRIYVSGENLLTFTKLVDQFDPEELGLAGWNDGKTYPLAKVYSVGLDIRF